MALDTDFHSHVVRSSAKQMVQSARDKGLRVLGLSEHDFQMHEAHAELEHMPLEGPMLTFAEYIESVRTAARDEKFDVRLGLEVDFIPERNVAIQASLRTHTWDFLIGSIHEIDGELFERNKPATQELGEALWLRYFQLLRAAASSGYFNVVSHPVRMRKTNPYLPATMDTELEQLAAVAKKNNVALELNGYDTLIYPDVVRRLARACAVKRTPVSVGSDAHNPRQVAQAHFDTAKILHESGISTVRIWKKRVAEDYKF